MSRPQESAQRAFFHMPQDWISVKTQSTARMQMPMNIQLPKLNFHSMSALIAAIGRFSMRARCETTRRVPMMAAAT